tara:strand:- start:30 stop:161 length:132 start_codon:yes stop_codon:yes gene_type:complete
MIFYASFFLSLYNAVPAVSSSIDTNSEGFRLITFVIFPYATKK